MKPIFRPRRNRRASLDPRSAFLTHLTIPLPRRRTVWRLPGLALLGGLCLQPSLALACRYNVRDIGFVDLETESYHFYNFVRADTPAGSLALLREMPAAALRNCNIDVEIINSDQQTNHPAMKHFQPPTSASWPAGVLVSPDGQTLPITLARADQSFRDSLAQALAEAAFSPARNEILRTISRAFGAVLLIEGDAPEANAKARQAITGAIEQIRSQMKSMPKTIAEPPVMVVLSASARARERILLWSLGLDPEPTPEPRAAVLYGRARWLGPLMKGEEITERNLVGILSFIGADCECGLDVSWTQGTRLPVRWDEGLHTQVTKALGFDPENPMIKLEASRIIRRGALSAGKSGGDREAPPSAFPPQGSTPGSSEQIRRAAQPASQTTELASSTPSLAVSNKLLIFGAGLVVTVAASAVLLVIIEAARRKRN